MASGIDMSARLITLAVNISVMGLLMTIGILHNLRDRLTGQLGSPQIQALAERIANGGEPAVLQQAFPQVNVSAGAALAGGFGLVTLYGGVAVCLIATASILVFGRAHGPGQASSSGPTPTEGSQPQPDSTAVDHH
jgi:hypothetical protein